MVKSHSNKVLPKSKKGVYLVMFRQLNKETGTLIYNYKYYPEIFFESIYYYLHLRNSKIIITHEWGYYLPILSTDLFKQEVVNNYYDTWIKSIPDTPNNA